MARRMLLAAAGAISGSSGNLISADSTADKIYVHSGVTSTITTSFSSPGNLPAGLAYDGANLISADLNAAKIFVHTGVTSTITTSFSSPGGPPKGLTIT